MSRFRQNPQMQQKQGSYHIRDQISHFLSSMPSGGVLSIFLVPTSCQFVDSTVPFDSTCSLFKPRKLVNDSMKRERPKRIYSQMICSSLALYPHPHSGISHGRICSKLRLLPASHPFPANRPQSNKKKRKNK